MSLLNKGTFYLTLSLAASGASTICSAAARDNDQYMPYAPYLYDNGGKTTLLVGYTDDAGHDNIVSQTFKMKGRGKNVKEKNVKFKSKHKVKKMKCGEEKVETDDIYSRGFSVLEIETDDIKADIADLEALEGVTTVEMDQEMHIMSVEYQQRLRVGKGADEHIREIQDAIKATSDQLREDEVGGGSTHGRRLAEETPWGIDMVNSTYVNNKTPPAGATPIKICVVDTGYGLGHPDLPNSSHGVDGYSPYGENELWDVDGDGHGTHCAGTIGAIGDNDIGVTSVNPDPSKFKFFIGKGLTDSGEGTGTGVMDAVQACVDNGSKVISMSLGSEWYSNNEDNKYADHYINDGVLIIAAAGNLASSAFTYPASYPAVVSVASVDHDRSRSFFSQYNTQVELAAPGRAVYSTITTNDGTGFSYASKSGTSMATPHVAGVAALLWYHFPDCTNNQIRNAMINSSKELRTNEGEPEWDDELGWGIINAQAAYDLLSTTGCEAAGYPPLEAGETPLGGKDQLGFRPTDPPTSAPTVTTAVQPSSEPSLTPSKSAVPSSHPSFKPSKSAQPSTKPSRQPSSQPSLTPSKSSVLVPSSHPSLKPSAASAEPSSEPSLVPSISLQPSSQPSLTPSKSSVLVPSSRPSLKSSTSTQPSFKPSRMPSSQPSLTPSKSSVLVPSSRPSFKPSKSAQPSSKPSRQPSSQPSLTPSKSSVLVPSSHPSFKPSKSAQPSSKPSRQPSSQPSLTPSKSSVLVPSSHPSFKPSKSAQPSSKPSRQPSSQPSLTPSKSSVLVPSSHPSLKPSAASAEPSSEPSLVPSISLQPSSQPSLTPSKSSVLVPSSHPSLKPSAASAKPSSEPSRKPSLLPSLIPTLMSSTSTQPSAKATKVRKGKGTKVRKGRVPFTSEPSLEPSISGQPSSKPSLTPSIMPSKSSQPSAKATKAKTAKVLFERSLEAKELKSDGCSFSVSPIVGVTTAFAVVILIVMR